MGDSGIQRQPEAELYHNEALRIQKELHEADKEDARGRAELMHAYGRAGHHQEANAIAKELEVEFPEDPRILRHAATGFSLCVAAVAHDKTEDTLTDDDKKLQQEFADQAIETLRKCIAHGYKSWASIEYGPDLEPIRDREMFAELLQKLKESAVSSEASP